MYYIFCNSEFENAVKEIPLTSAKKVYSVGNPNCNVQYYEIWELSDSDYITISETYVDAYEASYNLNNTAHIWQENWGWWRWCNGSVIEFNPTHTFVVNGNNIELYYDEMALINYANNILEDPNDDTYWPTDNLDEIPKSIKEWYKKTQINIIKTDLRDTECIYKQNSRSYDCPQFKILHIIYSML